jgi:hypothetical protein
LPHNSKLDTLAALGIDPHALEVGPDDVVAAPGWQARVYPDSPDRKGCSTCGQPATFTRLVPLPGLGPRWVDECRDHMIAGWHLRAGRP